MRRSAAVLERKAAERRREAQFRIAEAAAIGLCFGAVGSLRHGAGWLDMTKPWERPAIAWAWIGGSAVGGMLAGAFFGWMLPRMRMRRTALATGVGAAGIYLAVTALFGMDWLHSLLVPVTAPVVGVWAALLARDVSPVVVPKTQREVDELTSPATILTAWVVEAASAGTRVEPRRSPSATAAAAVPIPPAWRRALTRNVPLYSRLGDEARARLHRAMLEMLERVSFEGAAGQEITDEVRATVAGQACMLLLGHDREPYPDLRSIVVYPNAYAVPAEQTMRWNELNSIAPGRLGESWGHGTVVLSWSDVLAGAADPRDGHNLVFHEFAHQLDQEAGAADGVPSIVTASGYRAWTALLHRELEALRLEMDDGREDPVLRDYGATNEAELFAVATEAFFERPHALESEHPELYAALRSLYAFDPTVLHATAET